MKRRKIRFMTPEAQREWELAEAERKKELSRIRSQNYRDRHRPPEGTSQAELLADFLACLPEDKQALCRTPLWRKLYVPNPVTPEDVEHARKVRDRLLARERQRRHRSGTKKKPPSDRKLAKRRKQWLWNGILLDWKPTPDNLQGLGLSPVLDYHKWSKILGRDRLDEILAAHPEIVATSNQLTLLEFEPNPDPPQHLPISPFESH